MEQEDARKLSTAAQHERRRQVIRAYKRGVNRHRIAREVGLSYTAVRMIVKRYEDQGIRGLEMGRRGRPVSSGRSLTAGQEEHIQRLIKDHRPEQLKMDFALWTRAAVMLLIERECAVKLHVRSVGKYLKRWGFTPQKPIRRAYEQSPVAVRKWLDFAHSDCADGDSSGNQGAADDVMHQRPIYWPRRGVTHAEPHFGHDDARD